ncbi:MAG: DUF202 domain-containing protein [Desulfobacteraceae bacterium]|nr:DUF202 domain-containing protein [Desulfobacteraceae bacterium]
MRKEKTEETPFSRFDCDSLILRDELAIERTLLANERTLMAYLRSAVALLIAGVTMMHFSVAGGWFWLVGLACIPFGVIAGTVGIRRFSRMNSIITRIRYQAKEKSGEEETWES